MSELVERLRTGAKVSRETRAAPLIEIADVLDEAADALERMEAELETCRASHLRLEDLYNRALSKLGFPPFQQILASLPPEPPEVT